MGVILHKLVIAWQYNFLVSAEKNKQRMNKIDNSNVLLCDKLMIEHRYVNI